MSTLPPLPSDNGQEAAELIKSWFEECRRDHDQCKKALAGYIVEDDGTQELPTRVLDIGTSGSEHVTLIETYGRRANYCALSYRWGKPGTQTLITTQETIGDYLAGIQMTKLPAVFRDAVVTTRQLEIRFLWIDALCIVQGDEGDWEAESVRMADVYQNATLVLAASGSPYPGIGCFSATPRFSKSVEIPYYLPDGTVACSIHLLPRAMDKDTDPQYGPLSQRGWALQEAYLARRKLNFMPGGISWNCRVSSVDERAQVENPLEYSWGRVVLRYTRCRLTYNRDRLIALQGLADARAEGSDDRYHWGLYESAISSQLLWTHDEPEHAVVDREDVPTWSWASSGGGKSFVINESLHRWKTIVEITPPEKGSHMLTLQGFLITRLSQASAGPEVPALAGLRRIFFEDRSRESCKVTLTAGERSFGVGYLDRSHFGPIVALYVTAPRTVLYPEPLLTQYPALSTRTCLPWLAREVYGLLLLKPVYGRANYFERIGIRLGLVGPEQYADGGINTSRQTVLIV